MSQSFRPQTKRDQHPNKNKSPFSQCYILVPILAVAVTICNIIVSVIDIIVMDLHELWHIQISCQTVHLRV